MALPSRCGAMGKAIRSYTYVDDMVDGIYRSPRLAVSGPANIGRRASMSRWRSWCRPSPMWRGRRFQIRYVEARWCPRLATSATSGSTP